MNLYLVRMTRSLIHEFFQSFSYDPATIADTEQTPVYKYNKEAVNKYYDKHTAQGKIHFAIMLDDKIIGDIYLKDLDPKLESCDIGVHIVNDQYKGKGYGTQAEKILLSYIFNKHKMKTVYAETLIKNERSAHVLKKVGFIEVSRNDNMIRFACQKCQWNDEETLDKFIIT